MAIDRRFLANALTAFAVVGAMVTPASACQTRPVAVDQVKAPVEGKVAQAFACKDLEGEQLFIETRLAASVSNGKPQPTALTFYQFTLNAQGTLTRRWQARDFAPSDSRLSRSPQTSRFTARDVDGDGLAEAFIAYAMPGAAMGPDEGKLLVFHKDRKYAVRGVVALSPGGFSTRNIDPGFDMLPPAIQRHALQQWDALALPAGSATTVTQSVSH
jgi:hypothetical protein